MRYFIQFAVMMIDLIIIGLCAFIVYSFYQDPVIWILALLVFKAWNDQSGFTAWYPKNIKIFLANMKSIGL